MKEKHKVFVYGTLRSNLGESTHILPEHVMLEYEGRDFKFPYVVAHPDYDVFGNIIEVDDAELEQLDRYENIRSGLYVRKEVEVINSSTAESEAVWAYIAGPSLFNIVESGDWIIHSNQEN